MIRNKAAPTAPASPEWAGDIVGPHRAEIAYNVISGTENGDQLDGTEGDDQILGLGGFDMINGLGGNDLLEGGEGTDLLDGGTGDDILHGGAGSDFLDDLDSGYDQLFGDEGNDFIDVNHWPEDTGNTYIDGGTGDDDILLSLSDTDHSSHNQIFGGDGHDRIHAQSGGSGVLTAIDAGAGNDYVATLRLSSGAPAYTVTLGQGADLLFGVAGGSSGSVIVTDFQAGDAGDALLLVSSLTYRLTGWSFAANPFATGHLRLVQSGADTLLQIDLNGATGGAAFVTCATLQNVTSGDLTARNLGGFASDGSVAPGQTVAGTADPDKLSGTMSADVMTGGDGDDLLYGASGNDLIEGGEGRDELRGELGDDVLRGEGGSDSLWGGDTGNDQLFGGDAADQLFVSRLLAGPATASLMEGGAGNDRINFTSSVFGHSAIMRGGDDNDYFDVRAYGASIEIDGGAGADLLDIDADEGNRYVITLGGGADRINLYAPSVSTLSPFDVKVTDFAVGAGGDTLLLTRVLTYYADGWDGTTNPFTAGYVRLVQSGDDTILQIDRTGSAFGAFFVNLVTFENLDRQTFTADNFSGFAPNFGNVAPAISAPGTTAYSESVNGPPASVAVAGSLTLTDADDLALASATAAITGGFQAGEDSLSFANTSAGSFGNIAASYDAASGLLTLTSAGATATVEQWQNALRAVRYSNSSEEPNGATRTVSFSASDGQLTSAVATHDVSVTARNDSPAGADGTLTVDEDSVFTFALSNFGFSDIDGDLLASVRIGAAPTGGRIFFDSDGSGPNSALQITGFPATVSAADIAAGKLTFRPTLDLYGPGAASVRFQVIDNGGGGSTDPTPNTLTFNITPLDDTLFGGPGADALAGGGGNDRYYIDESIDTVIEAFNAGFDRVLSSVSWTLNAGSHVEMITTQDNDATTAINLTGNALSQYIYGNAGANVIDGGGGGDVMYGFEGDDRFYIRNASDRVVEFAAGGFDRVLAESSFTLEAGSQVEMFTTTDNLATTAIHLTGNELFQYLYGNAGANVIDGGGGGDVMYGFEGDDFFVIRDAADRVVEFAGGGSDRVFAAANFTLEAGSEVEMFTTIDNLATTAINLTGNELVQYIYGNAGANTLDGKSGADVLTGFGGADSFAFTSVLDDTVDRIADFVSGSDGILLDDAVFAGLAPGTLDSNAFAVGSGAADADDRIVYDSATGRLFFDADGGGAGAMVHFATLDGAPIIGASDFTVI